MQHRLMQQVLNALQIAGRHKATHKQETEFIVSTFSATNIPFAGKVLAGQASEHACKHVEPACRAGQL